MPSRLDTVGRMVVLLPAAFATAILLLTGKGRRGLLARLIVALLTLGGTAAAVVAIAAPYPSAG
jgi:hypothetical protein